ncbi:hypothetical protein [Burkholderia cepacia]|uniref:hypothetical protein n=1 Tax=Burkholderia cepacia TaxID=292 RepID=UPI000A700410|nr:hypothetical protein [Burkholderia cepacia]
METKDTIRAADFGLAPNEFVRRVFKVKFDRDIDGFEDQINFLAYQLMQGVPRLEIISAVERLAQGRISDNGTIPNSLRQTDPPFLNSDILEAFSPEDNEAFIDLCCDRMLGKQLPAALRIQSSFELRKGSITRKDFINSLLKFANFDGKDINLFEFGANAKTIELQQHVINDGILDGQYVFARRYQNGLSVFSADGWHQKLGISDANHQIHPGWLFSGPKKNLPAGKWVISLDCAQGSNDQLVLDVVADCGLTNLLDVTLEGSCVANFSFQIKPEHSFIEIRLRRTDRSGTGIVRVNNFSVIRGET